MTTTAPVPHRLLARGRHASVWEARHDGAMVAWKRFDDAGADALRRERAARAAVVHPYLLPSLADTDDGIVLPLASTSLAKLARDGATSPGLVTELVHEVGSALAALHDAGWVHGDVAPTNIVRLSHGWCLTDLDQAGPALAPRSACGTPGYAAPEVVRGGPGSCAADVHAFAATVLAVAGADPGMSRELHRTLELATHPDPGRRPPLAQLVGCVTHAPRAGSKAPGTVDLTARTVDFPSDVAAPADNPSSQVSPLPATVAIAGLLVTLVLADESVRHLALLVQSVPAVGVLAGVLGSDHRRGRHVGVGTSEVRQTSDPRGRVGQLDARARQRGRGVVGQVVRGVREVVDGLRRHLEEALDAGDVVQGRGHGDLGHRHADEPSPCGVGEDVDELLDGQGRRVGQRVDRVDGVVPS